MNASIGETLQKGNGDQRGRAAKVLEICQDLHGKAG